LVWLIFAFKKTFSSQKANQTEGEADIGATQPDAASLHVRKKEVVVIKEVRTLLLHIKNLYKGEKLMKSKQIGNLLSLLVALSLLLAACGPQEAPITEEPAMQEPEAPAAATEAPAAV